MTIEKSSVKLEFPNFFEEFSTYYQNLFILVGFYFANMSNSVVLITT